MNAYIQLIKECGFRVFIHPGNNPLTYCYYTDGVHIGYAQWSRYNPGVSTVHKPNHTSGTGYVYADEITPETIKGAAISIAPQWAYDWRSVKKYCDWESFYKSSKWNSEMVEV